MAGLGNTGLASARNRNYAAVVGKPHAARSNLPISQGNTRRCGAGCRWPADWRNKCCSRCVRGLNRHSPSRKTNWAWATCSSTACGSLGRWHCWRMRRCCCGREHCSDDQPRASCLPAWCPFNFLWNWMRRPSRPVHRSQTLIRKIPNEIKVSRFGFRNTLYYNNTIGTLKQVIQAGIKKHKQNKGIPFENPAADLKRTKVKQKELQLPESSQFRDLVANIRKNSGG